MKIKLRNLLILFVILCFYSCKSSKEWISYDKVKEGQQLEKAQEITVNDFFQMWMLNKYPTKVDINCHELFKDERYTYFGKTKLKVLDVYPNLYKVQNDLLDSLFENYKKIDGQEIKREFWDLYIPQSDKDIWMNSKCTSSTSNPKYICELQKDKIFIKLHWKVKCDGRKILDKSYVGYYDMNKMKFDNE